ncbi:MAG: hypothetical protein A2040_15590 [Rhodocyclales bacterium GWA2_65_19]|nr:MAG: hypothetical protein A2040_15590 [Rhodocyclales bacterium GWA2_65_19]
MNPQANPLTDILAAPEAFGLSAGMLLRLDEAADYRHLAYLDLMPAARKEPLPDAVLEADGSAAVYLAADASLLADPVRLAALRETLACRGDARYLGVVQPGVLHVFPLGFYEGRGADSLREIPLRPGGELHDFLAGLSEGEGKGLAAAEKAWLDNYLLELLRSTARNLKKEASLSDGQVLSLVGRGLFARFIVDRRIVRDADARRISPHAASLEALFDAPEAAADCFAWLDATFNGNLLPLLGQDIHTASAYRDFFSSIGKDAERIVCRELGNVMRRAVHGQLPMKWQRIQFDHVPADTLSQVYEHFAHLYWSEFAAATSIHYTPRRIAQVLVDAAFAGLSLHDPSRARVLDPAVGAGVFLVLAFKRLVQERWRITGQRPERRDIRHILEHQLCGLDLNPEALKFAALSLYLTALELDPSPTPLAELKFKALDKTGTLLDVGKDGQILRNKKTGKGLPLGSLSTPPPSLGGRRFDMVIGNPPWSELEQLAAPALTTLVRDVARRKGVATETVEHLQVDNGIPDVPFVWRALDWAEEGGIIAFALHAQHLLFQQGNGASLRSALLECLELTGLLNGSALRYSKVWPTVEAPFCFLLARNKKPEPDSAFYYLNPVPEEALNRGGRMRLDPHTAMPVAQSLAQSSPYLFKILFRGTPLDHAIVGRIAGHPRAKPLGDYWHSLGLNHSKGFQVFTKGQDTSHLVGKKMLETKDQTGFEIDVSSLRDFAYPEGLHRPRDPAIYLPPLVLLRQSPKLDRAKRGGLLARGEVVYSESFIGYSAAGHPQGEALARYVQLLSHSDVFLFYLLMTSAQFGIERDAGLKEDIDRFPFIPFESLTESQREYLPVLSAHLIEGKNPWDAIDAFFAELYGLTPADRQVVRDTLDTALPYTKTQKHARQSPDANVVADFAAEVARIVAPFARRMNLPLRVRPEDVKSATAWRFIRIDWTPTGQGVPALSPAGFAGKLAAHFWASQVCCHDPTGYGLIVGQIAQNRYWTKTRARMLALDLLNTGLEQLVGSKGSAH